MKYQPAASSQQPAASSQQPAASPQSAVNLLREISFRTLQNESKRIARRLQVDFSVSKAEAEDAVSAAWEAVLEHIDLRFDGFPKLCAWVRKDTWFRLKDLKKHLKVLKIEKFEDQTAEIDNHRNYNDIEHIFDGRDSHRWMLKCLDVHERSVIMVHHWLELSFEEMAEIRRDGLSADVLRQRYHRAMIKLKTYIKKNEMKQNERLQN